ncbi:hypothetical protein [Actinophytocola sp.]|uniref:hypothetical protein n=1 Tax=Actinophytocola sp. TaxID=1872138 RepID=UPI0039C88EA5
MVDILHDWDDDHAHRILARCAGAAHPTGRDHADRPTLPSRIPACWVRVAGSAVRSWLT